MTGTVYYDKRMPDDRCQRLVQEVLTCDEQVASLISTQMRDAIRLDPTEAESSSRFGGVPGGRGKWPHNSTGLPLEFIGKIDFSCIPESYPVARLGRHRSLDVFVAPVSDEPGGYYGDIDDRDCFQLVESESIGSMIPPDSVYVYPVVNLSFVGVHSLPPIEIVEDILPVDYETWELLGNALASAEVGPVRADEPAHFIGGWSPAYPSELVATDGSYVMAESSDRVEHLMTVSSDQRAEFMFLDGGSLVWFARQKSSPFSGASVGDDTILTVATP